MKKENMTVHPLTNYYGGQWLAHRHGDIAVVIGSGPISRGTRIYGVAQINRLIKALEKVRPEVKMAEDRMRRIASD